MADIYEEFEFAVRSYECAPDGKVTVANLCNYLQEAASINAEHLGFNKSNFDAEGLNITWVMTRMRIKCSRRPVWGEKVKILTFPLAGVMIYGMFETILFTQCADDRANTDFRELFFFLLAGIVLAYSYELAPKKDRKQK